MYYRPPSSAVWLIIVPLVLLAAWYLGVQSSKNSLLVLSSQPSAKNVTTSTNLSATVEFSPPKFAAELKKDQLPVSLFSSFFQLHMLNIIGLNQTKMSYVLYVASSTGSWGLCSLNQQLFPGKMDIRELFFLVYIHYFFHVVISYSFLMFM